MGLLSKADELKNTYSSAFTDFIILNNIKTFAVFQLKNNFYKIINSIGFDGMSLVSSESSLDFWNGICPEENEIYNFTCYNKTLNPILQFFSFNMKDNINSVSLYKTTDKIYMLCNKEFNTSIIKMINNTDLSNNIISLEKINNEITSSSVVYKYSVDFTEAIRNFLKTKNVNNDNILETSIFNEIYNRLNIFLIPFAVKITTPMNLNLLLIVSSFITKEHIISHIKFNMETILGNFSKLIKFSNLGTVESIKDIKDFFQVD